MGNLRAELPSPVPREQSPDVCELAKGKGHRSNISSSVHCQGEKARSGFGRAGVQVDAREWLQLVKNEDARAAGRVSILAS